MIEGASRARPTRGTGGDVIQAPVRLRVVATLAAIDGTEFALVRDQLGVSDSVLSNRLSETWMAKSGFIAVMTRVT